jgi:hypothetical protein
VDRLHGREPRLATSTAGHYLVALSAAEWRIAENHLAIHGEAVLLIMHFQPTRKHNRIECDSMKFSMLASLILPVLVSSGCKPNSDLTRERAFQLINKGLQDAAKNGSGIQQVSFKRGGVNQAMQDGVITSKPGTYAYFFTPKGLKMVGTFITANEIVGLGIGSGVIRLKNARHEDVVEVTGIADTLKSGTKVVEFKTKYVFAAELEPMTKYLDCSYQSKKVIFVKYDDGWRINDSFGAFSRG